MAAAPMRVIVGTAHESANDDQAWYEASLRSRARWLETEVLPHRHWLRAWISRRYPGEGDVDILVKAMSMTWCKRASKRSCAAPIRR